MTKEDEKNIVLITIDCLRGDNIHCMNYPKNISPNLDKLAKDGILFTNAFANAPYTPFSVPSFITSRLPPVGKTFKETIASVLKKHGYSTASFNPNPIVMTFITKSGKINKGFDIFDMMLTKKGVYDLGKGVIRQYVMKHFRRALKEEGLTYKYVYPIYDKMIKTFSEVLCPKEHIIIPSAEEINSQALNWIKQQNGKFFVWLHYMDVHEPYAPPNYENQKEMLYLITKYRDFPNMLTKQEIVKLKNLYDLSIKYVDLEIYNFINKLKELGKFGNTVFIISADHGDAFAEHDGILGHGGKYTAQVYDEVLHVPLIIYGLNQKGVIDNNIVQLLDLAPTICDISGISIPEIFFGESVFSTKQNGVIFNSATYIGFRTKKYKLIIHKIKENNNELYDLENDPKENNNIYYSDKSLANKLEIEMTTVLENFNKKKSLIDIQSKFI